MSSASYAVFKKIYRVIYYNSIMSTENQTSKGFSTPLQQMCAIRISVKRMNLVFKSHDILVLNIFLALQINNIIIFIKSCHE